MSIRVTSNSFFRQAIASSQARTAEIANLHIQLSSGLRIHRPSDAPADTRDVLIERSREGRLDSILLNITDARSRLNISNGRLLDVNEALVAARSIVLQANNPLDSETRESLAKQVDSLLARVLDSANSQDRGDYVFGGTNIQAKPFVLDGTIATAVSNSIQYVGSSDRASVLVGTEVTVDTYYSGADVFLSQNRGDALILGETGAASGISVDSAYGVGSLQVSITSLAFAAGSGVQAGASVLEGTIIGPAGRHYLTIDDTSGTGAAGTVSLNGGGEIAFTSADTDLLVSGPTGGLVHLDMSAITAGFSGTVDITAAGTLSTDGGLSSVPLDFSNNQQVVNSEDGTVTYIDSREIASVGTDSIEYLGTASVFDTLIHLRDDLRNSRNFGEGELSQAFTRRLDELDRTREHILQVVAEQSVSLEHLDALEYRTEDLQLEIRQIISELESTDISEVILRLQEQENLLQFTYASTSSILSSTNLLNFLR